MNGSGLRLRRYKNIVSNMCDECKQKDLQVKYLKAIIALHGLKDPHILDPGEGSRKLNLVEIQQRQIILKQQLLLVRADIQYLNREVQNVFEWIAKVISVFLSCCGRLTETTASLVVESATKVGNNVSRIIGK